MARKNWAMIYNLGFGYPYYYPVLYTGTFTTSSATVPADTGAGALYGNNYFDGCILMPLSGACAYQPRKILSFATTTGIFTMNNPFSAAPGTVQYMILIDAVDPVVGADSSANTAMLHVVGNKADTAVLKTSVTASLSAYAKGLLDSKLIYTAPITTAALTTTFAATRLIGFGDGYFKGWYAYIVWDAGAQTAPQGEYSLISAYTSSSGTFTITAYTVAHAVTDIVMIVHPSIAGAGLGFLADAAATGAVTTTDTGMAYIKQIVTNTYRLGETACADVDDPVDMTTEVADNTILANVLTDDGDTSVYDRRIHSLEALYNGTTIRTISAGTKTIASAGTKYLSFDSTTYGAEIISIIVKGLIGAAWTLDVYVPTDDAVASPAAADKRDTIAYLSTDTEGGLLQGFGIIYNGFLNLTNNGAGDQTITDAVIVYRSRAALSVAWEE